MKTNMEIMELTKGYTLINCVFRYIISASGKNVFQYKGNIFDTYEDNGLIGEYWVFFNPTNKKCLVYKKN